MGKCLQIDHIHIPDPPLQAFRRSPSSLGDLHRLAEGPWHPLQHNAWHWTEACSQVRLKYKFYSNLQTSCPKKIQPKCLKDRQICLRHITSLRWKVAIVASCHHQWCFFLHLLTKKQLCTFLCTFTPWPRKPVSNGQPCYLSSLLVWGKPLKHLYFQWTKMKKSETLKIRCKGNVLQERGGTFLLLLLALWQLWLPRRSGHC